MQTYQVRVPFEGYSRGYIIYEVEAESEREALRYPTDGLEINRDIVRDDTEKFPEDAEIY